MSTEIDLTAHLAATDPTLRNAAFERVLRKVSWTENERQAVLDAFPQLASHRQVGLVATRGKQLFDGVDAPSNIVAAIAKSWPTEPEFWLLGFDFHPFSVGLGENAYADLVARLGLKADAIPGVLSGLRSALRGCALFMAALARKPYYLGSEPTVFGASELGILLRGRTNDHDCAGALRDLAAQSRALRLWVFSLALQCGVNAARPLITELLPAVQEEAMAPVKSMPKPAGEMESESGFDHYGHALWSALFDWVRTDPNGAPGRWLADRVTEGRFFPFALGIPKDLQDPIARLLIDGDVPSFADDVLQSQLDARDPKAWPRVFRWIEANGPWVYRRAKRFLLEAPLPHEPDDLFDETFTNACKTIDRADQEQLEQILNGYRFSDEDRTHLQMHVRAGEDWRLRHPMTRSLVEQFQPRVTATAVFDRLSTLPLTAKRARRLLSFIDKDRGLLSKPAIDDIVSLLGPLPRELLPPLNHQDWCDPSGGERLLRLGGSSVRDELRECVRAWARDCADPGKDLRVAHFGMPLRDSLVWHVVDDALAQEVRAILLPRLRDVGPTALAIWAHSMPWIVSAADVVRAAEAHIEDPKHVWAADFGLSSHILDLVPHDRVDLVRRRVECSTESREVVALLAWLELRELHRNDLVQHALSAIRRVADSYGVIKLLAPYLKTRSAWEKHGAAIWLTLLQAERGINTAFRFLESVATAVPEVEAQTKVVRAMHLTLATVLIDAADREARAGDWRKVKILLDALLKIEPPPSVVPALHRLRKVEGFPEAELELANMAVELFKDEAGREAELGDILEALGAAAAALGAGSSLAAE